MKTSNSRSLNWATLRIFVLVLLSSVAAFAQNDKKDETETLFGKGNLRISGFGAPIVEFSNVNGQFSVSNGGGGAALFNQVFFIGGYGIGLSNRVVFNHPTTSQQLDFRHGGFWLGYVSSPKKLVHFTGSMRLGWGNVGVQNNNFGNNFTVFNQSTFVSTPEVGLEVNITRFFKITATAGYRFVTGINKTDFTNAQGTVTEVLSNSNFSSPMGSLAFKFGLFR